MTEKKPEDQTEKPPAAAAPRSQWWEGVSAAAPALLTAVGAAGAALIAQRVADDLGKGQAFSSTDKWLFAGCLLVLGLSLGLVVALPLVVRVRSRVVLQDVKPAHAGKEAFGGYDNGDALATRLNELQGKIRSAYESGDEPWPWEVEELNFLINARQAALEAGRNHRTRTAGYVAAGMTGVLGAIAALSYGALVALTNSSIEDGDEERREELLAEQRELQGSPGFFDEPIEVLYSKTDAKGGSCDINRAGIALELTGAPAGAPVDAVVKVILLRTADCAGAEVRATPGELTIPEEKAPTTTSPPNKPDSPEGPTTTE